MSKTKLVDTPLSSTEKLSVTEGEALGPVESTKYRSFGRGTSQHLTFTHPDISFALNKV